MKMSRIIALVLVIISLVSTFVACGPTDGPGPDAGNSKGKIEIWVSEKKGVKEFTKAQIERFLAENPNYGYTIDDFVIEGVSEANAASQVLMSVAEAPDIYCFAQDQLARLVQANALAAPNETVAAELKASNDSVSVSAASVAGTMYAYPLTSDNGYYLYYDTSIISAEEADSLEAIIAACEANGKTFRFALENAWYTASFFFATGCHSNWTTDEAGKFTNVDDNFDGENGLIAMKGMQKLAQSSCYDPDNNIFTNAGAIVTGIWHANDAAAHFGENLGATDLPSFEVDGKSYHLGSYSGNKLLGVKPQADSKKGLVLALLAQYLTGAECQLQRYDLVQWGPSNLEAQQNESVKTNISLNALALQGNYAIPQGNIHGSWWDIAKVLGVDAKAAETADDLQAALVNYRAAIDALFEMTDEELKAWSVIGSICGTNWDTDISMSEVSEGVYESGVLALNAGEEFKCRQGASWTVNFGADGNIDGPNCVVDAAGNYVVRLTIISDTKATIELIPQ